MIETTAELDCTVPEEELEAFLAGSLHGAPRVRVLEHLLAGCTRCRGFLPGRPPLPHLHPDAAAEQSQFVAGLLRRLTAQSERLDKEAAATARLLPDFLRHPVERQRTILHHQAAKYATYSFVDGLVDAAFEEIYDRPRRTEELLELALALVEQLDVERYGQRVVADLEARVLAHRANAHRTFGRLTEARRTLALAKRKLGDGSLDPITEAEVGYFEGTLLFAERRLPAALASIRRSREVFEEFSDAYSVGLCLNAESGILETSGSSVAAIEAAQQAIERVDPAQHPKLAGAARGNLVWSLTAAGRTDEALARLDEFRPFCSTFADGPTRNRLTWRHAKLAAQQGDLRSAERLYREAAEKFLELELPYEAAGVSLELALLLHDQGRFDEVREIAAADLSTFRGLGVEPDAIAAWVAFRNAAEAEAVSRSLLERLSAYFQTAKVRPGHPFEG